MGGWHPRTVFSFILHAASDSQFMAYFAQMAPTGRRSGQKYNFVYQRPATIMIFFGQKDHAGHFSGSNYDIVCPKGPPCGLIFKLKINFLSAPQKRCGHQTKSAYDIFGTHIGLGIWYLKLYGIEHWNHQKYTWQCLTFWTSKKQSGNNRKSILPCAIRIDPRIDV